MNEGVRFSANPKHAAKARAVPLEVRAMARQLGISTGEMAEADVIWRKLNQLHTTDPEGYKELAKESAKQMKQQQKGEPPEKVSDKAAKVVQKMLPQQSLTPVPGFVIKCDLGNRNKAMINCCSHAAVQPPIEPSGREVEDPTSAKGLHVPMAVGEPRPCTVSGGGRGTAVDVVFNPCVLQKATSDRDFKNEVSVLALRWVAKERGLGLDLGKWKYINSRYKGGTGPGRDAPVPLPIDAASDLPPPKEAEAPEPGVTTGVTATPESLLRRMRETRDAEAEEPPAELRLPEKQPPAKKKLIEEITEEVIELEEGGFDISETKDDEVPNAEEKTKKKRTAAKKTKPSVKKGFLKGSKAPLYPKGSDQGQGEGVYSRFMGKCKVVDTSTMSKDEQKAMIQAHAGTSPTTPASTTTTTTTTKKKGSRSGFAKGFFDSSDKAKKIPPKTSAVWDPEFDRLASEADPEYRTAANNAKQAQNDPEVEETLDQLRRFASKLEAQDRTYNDFRQSPPATDPSPDAVAQASSDPPAQSPPNDDSAFRFKSGFLDQPTTPESTNQEDRGYEIARLEPDADGRRRLMLTIRLQNVDSFVDVALDVATRVVKIDHPPTDFKLKIPLSGFVADPALAQAKFSKKQSTLFLTLTHV
ncbi:hypothetical protein CTAYLR_002893 [Chrysophaeum taylorii]|uniref:PIH1 domain-containing protein 1 n=1 Tax=Chrysophaeum taylorii TaxID=2483200 RepID=A0AAD7UM63_9STRA|nr:hypothetical protein CTAYLR_002893 [Chrysophaeum taylorii]